MPGASLPPVRYRSDVQGLRAVAVLLVVLFHAGLGFSGGYVGVDVFFVVSGFVITRMLQRELSSTGRVSLRGFYARRVKRILPALATMTIGVLVLAALLTSPDGPQQVSAATARSASLFTANVQLYRLADGYFAVDQTVNLFLHTWSLAVEEQFYVVFPLLVLVTSHLSARHRGRNLTAVLTLFAVTSFLLSAWVGWGLPFLPGVPLDRFAYYLPFTRAWEFLAGSLLALARPEARSLPHPLHPIITGAAVTAVIGSALWFDEHTTFPGVAALVPVLGTVSLIAAAAPGTHLWRLLSCRPLVRLGDLSYSWYLWHWPGIVLVSTLWPTSWWAKVLGAGTSLLPAWLSWRFVEGPWRRAAWDGRRVLALAVTCCALPFIVAVGVRAGAKRHWGFEELAPLDDRTVARLNGCHSDDQEGLEWNPASCTFDVPMSAGTMLLVGDSHAISMADALQAVGQSQQLDLAVWTRSSCGFIAAVEDDDELCRLWRTRAIELVDQLDPDVVVIVNRAPWGDARDVDDYINRLDDVLTQVGSRPVVVVGTGVVFPFTPLYSRSLARPEGAGYSLPLEELRSDRAYLDEGLHRMLKGRTNVVFVDPLLTMCNARCPARMDGTWLYYDSHHVTPEGSLRLVEPIADSVRRSIVHSADA